jgi:hypothetical protein
MMLRLNPTQDERIGFAAFSEGLLGWLKDHAAALPSPAASEEAPAEDEGEEVDDKENAAVASPLRELAGNRAVQPSPWRTSPSKHTLQQVCSTRRSVYGAILYFGRVDTTNHMKSSQSRLRCNTMLTCLAPCTWTDA